LSNASAVDHRPDCNFLLHHFNRFWRVPDCPGGQLEGRGGEQEGEREQADGLRVVVSGQVFDRQAVGHEGQAHAEGAGREDRQ